MVRTPPRRAAPDPVRLRRTNELGGLVHEYRLVKEVPAREGFGRMGMSAQRRAVRFGVIADKAVESGPTRFTLALDEESE